MKKILVLSVLVLMVGSNVHAGFWDMFSSNKQEEPSFFEKIGKNVDDSITDMEKRFNEWKQEISVRFFSPKESSGYNESKGIYFVEIALAGYEEKEISVQAKVSQDQHLLIIKANKEKADTTSQEKASFQLTRTLPEDIEPEKASWSYKNGMLRIEFPADIKKVDVITIKRSDS